MSSQNRKTVRPVTRLEKARRDKRLRQEDLAELSGLSRATIAAAERGYEPSPITASAIAEVLGVDPSKIWPGFKR